MRQSLPLEKMIWLVSSYSLSNAASSDTLPSSANWESFPRGFDLQHPACFSAPSQCNMHGPHLDLNHFLCSASVGEAQLHHGGSSPRPKLAAPVPPLAWPLLAPAAMLSWVEICHTGAERCGGTHGLGNTDLFSGFNALAGKDPSLKATRDGRGKTSPFQQ